MRPEEAIDGYLQKYRNELGCAELISA
jgi:hypothetical protein